ncbi:MAG: ATP synthase subunit I [Acidimicrobiales bacterium]
MLDFDRFSLPDLVRMTRRTMLGALVAGAVGLVACLLFSQPWAGLGLCVGVALGISNFRMVQRSVVKVGRRMSVNRRRPLAMSTMGRMALVTVVALALVLVLPPLGFGLLGGMALFQFVLLGNVTRSMLRMSRTPITDPPPGAAPADGPPAAGPALSQPRPVVEVPDDGWGDGWGTA